MGLMRGASPYRGQRFPVLQFVKVCAVSADFLAAKERTERRENLFLFKPLCVLCVLLRQFIWLRLRRAVSIRG